MLKPKTQTLSDRAILKVKFFEHELIFLISPTWAICPNCESNLSASDFAVGCEDYLAGFEPQYSLISEYKAGYKAAEELGLLIDRANFSFNFPGN